MTPNQPAPSLAYQALLLMLPVVLGVLAGAGATLLYSALNGSL